jgi:RNA polymerase sigma-70 factor (ECF subfamily)
LNNGRVTASTKELIVAAQAGDHAAIISLMDITHGDIRRYARRACRIEDVDDAVQETLTTIWTHIRSLRTAAAFAGWLFIIVSRECYRLSRRHLWFWSPLSQVENKVDPWQRPEAELRYDLGMAIKHLPPHYRTILMKRDVEGLAVNEIAKEEGLTREAVKARLRRARLLIRKYLAGEKFGEDGLV